MPKLILIGLFLLFGCDNKINSQACYDANSLPITNGISTCGINPESIEHTAGDDWHCCDSNQASFRHLPPDDSPHPIEMSLNYACPNPAVGNSTHISYNVDQLRHIYLRLINNQGELVNTLINNNVEAGYHFINFNFSNDLENGVYRLLLSLDHSEEIFCYGDICLCGDLSLEDCSSLCGTMIRTSSNY
jgi:hypothetical protein